MKIEFDPNNNTPPAIEWATYIPDRRPKFKTHKGRGQALNAFQYRDTAILYKYDFDARQWVEIYREEDEPKPDVCAICCESLLVERTRFAMVDGAYRHIPTGEFWNRGTRVWVDTDRDPHRVVACSDCARTVKRERHRKSA